jgi:hypothetical protein
MVQSDFGFIACIVSNNLNTDIMPTEQQSFHVLLALTVENW